MAKSFKRAIHGLFLSLFLSFNSDLLSTDNEKLQMTGFEPRISSVRGDRFTYSTTTTAHRNYFTEQLFQTPGFEPMVAPL